MANFCQAFNMSPTEYRSLTMAELTAYLKIAEKIGDS